MSFLYSQNTIIEEIPQPYWHYSSFSNLTTIPVEPEFLWPFVLLSLKTCSLYHEKLFIQKFKVIGSQVLNNFLSASDIMEAVRGHFCFYRYKCKVAWYQLDCFKVSLDNKHKATDYPGGGGGSTYPQFWPLIPSWYNFCRSQSPHTINVLYTYYLRVNLVQSGSVHLVLLFSHTAPHPLEARVLTAPASRKKLALKW